MSSGLHIRVHTHKYTVHTLTHVHAHTHTNTYTMHSLTYVHTQMHAQCILSHVYTQCILSHMCTHKYIHNTYSHTCAHTQAHTQFILSHMCTHKCTHNVYSHTCTHTNTYKCILSHMCMHTHTPIKHRKNTSGQLEENPACEGTQDTWLSVKSHWYKRGRIWNRFRGRVQTCSFWAMCPSEPSSEGLPSGPLRQNPCGRSAAIA